MNPAVAEWVLKAEGDFGTAEKDETQFICKVVTIMREIILQKSGSK